MRQRPGRRRGRRNRDTRRSVPSARSSGGYRAPVRARRRTDARLPLTSSRSPSPVHLHQRRPAPGPFARAARTKAASPAGSAGTATSAGSSARASVSRAPALAPRSAAALVTAWMRSPCVPSTVRTTGASGAEAVLFAQRSIARCGNQMESTRFMRDAPPARRMPARAEQLGIPRRCSRRARVERIEQRRRARDPPAHPRPAEIGSAAEPHQPAGRTRLRSDATASRRVAVKSSARGSPQISPITAESAAHLTPSSIAHSASRASRASTWMRSCDGKPRRMDPPALQDRHPVLDPQQGLVRAELRQQEPRPAAVARVRGEQLGQGGAGRNGQAAIVRPARWGAGRFRPHGFRRRRPGKGLQPHNSQRSCSTFVLCLATQRRESMARLDRRSSEAAA